MHHLLTALIGAALGLVAAWLTGAQRWMGIVDMAVGALGAVPAAWFLAPLSSSPASSTLPTPSECIGATLGAVFVLAVWVFVRPRGK